MFFTASESNSSRVYVVLPVLLRPHRLDQPALTLHTERGAPAIGEVINGITETVRGEVVDPDTLERSVGKLQRLKDLRQK